MAGGRSDRDEPDDDGRNDGEEPGGPQRLDKWLWFARVVKTRTLAAKLVADGRVRVNRERTDKPSQPVKPGDVLTISVHRSIRVLEIVGIGRRRGPAPEAQALYVDRTPPASREDGAAGMSGQAPSPAAARMPGQGRPTKRDRRVIDRLKRPGERD
ncbi:MAG: RNA-binding S4 domain-containing protein [Hyphomicrobiaceae bacterium]